MTEERLALHGAGLRATAARMAVLHLLRNVHQPLSHADVAARIGRRFDRATIYRNLIELSEAGLACRSDLGDHIWRFSDTSQHASHDPRSHPHFICTSCGEVRCLPKTAVRLGSAGRAPSALRRSPLEIQVRGLCDGCC